MWYSPMVGEVLNGLSVAAGTALLQPVDLLGWFMLQGSCEWHLCMKFLVCMEAENMKSDSSASLHVGPLQLKADLVTQSFT